jgi:ribosome-binding protein aMBF1 (putative translation factor)
MNATREEKLQAAGWKVSTVNEFLGLTPEESALIETRLALSSLLRKQRSDAALSQEGLAEKIHSSQSRIAKAEKGDPSISFDFLFRALLGAGTTNQQIGETIARTDAKT